MKKSHSTWPLIIFFYSLLLPPEIFFEISGFRFYGFRLVEFGLFPYVLLQLLSGRIKINIVDILNIFSTAWIVISYSAIHDLLFAIESGTVLAADILIAYFLARVCIRNISDIRHFLLRILPGVGFSAAMLFLESVLGELIFRPAISSLFGSARESDFGLRAETRLGLLRAYGPFYHPIMAGMFLTSLLPLYILIAKPRKISVLGVMSCLGAVFCLSSSAFLGIILVYGLYAYEKIQRVIANINWPLLVVVAFTILVTLHIFSENGIIAVLNRYLLLNPSTGYYRTLIWEYAGAAAMENPLYGIGRNEWYRPPWMRSGSIDAHFLLLAVRHGMPSAISAFSAYLVTIFILSRRVSTAKNNESRNMFLALAIALFTVLIGQFTVAAVLTTQAIVMILLGMSVSVGYNFSKTVILAPRKPAGLANA